MRWPQAMQSFFEFQGAFSTIGEHLVNPDCTTDLKPAELFYAKQIAYLTLPVCLIIVVYIIWKSYAIWENKEWSRPQAAKMSIVNKDLTWSSRTYVNIKDKFVVTVCVLVYLFYPTLCKQAFGLFTCYKVNGKRYLLADLEEECNSGRHYYYVIAVGIPQLIIFVIGLPLAGLYFLYRNRHRLDTLPVRARYGLFFGGYKSNRYYWEIFLIVRKVSVIAISSFGAAMDAEMQSLILMMVLMICYGLQHIGQPFEITGEEKTRHRILPGLELAVLSMLMMTLWAGLMMFKLNESGEYEFVYMILTVSTVGANVIFVFVLLFILLRQLLHEKRQQLATNNTESSGDGGGVGVEMSPVSSSVELNIRGVEESIENPLQVQRSVSRSRRETIVPHGWIRHVAESGDAYYEGPDGVVTWDKPPGNVFEEEGIIVENSNPMGM